MHPVPEVDVIAARSQLEADEATFVDVRDRRSYEASHVPGAIHVTDHNVDEFVVSTDKERPLVVYCYHGNASRGGTLYFQQQGFRTVHSLRGGFEAWRGGNPVEEGPGTP